MRNLSFTGLFVSLIACSASLNTPKTADAIDPNQNKVSLTLTSGKTAEIYSSSSQRNIDKACSFAVEVVSSSASEIVYQSTFAPRSTAAASGAERPNIRFRLPGPESMTSTTTVDQISIVVEEVINGSAVAVSAAEYSAAVEQTAVNISVKEFDLHSSQTYRIHLTLR